MRIDILQGNKQEFLDSQLQEINNDFVPRIIVSGQEVNKNIIKIN